MLCNLSNKTLPPQRHKIPTCDTNKFLWRVESKDSPPHPNRPWPTKAETWRLSAKRHGVSLSLRFLFASPLSLRVRRAKLSRSQGSIFNGAHFTGFVQPVKSKTWRSARKSTKRNTLCETLSPPAEYVLKEKMYNYVCTTQINTLPTSMAALFLPLNSLGP